MDQPVVKTTVPTLGNSGDNDLSSSRILLETLHCGDKQKAKVLLFIPSPCNSEKMLKSLSLDKRGYQVIFFLFLHENVCCGYPLEAPH